MSKLYTIILVVVLGLAIQMPVFAQGHYVAWQNTFNENFFKLQQVGFSSDSKYLAVGYDKGTVRVFTADSGFVVRQYHPAEYHVYCTKFRPGTTVVASGDKKGNIVLYDFQADKELFRIKAHEKAVTAMYFSSDGKWMITGSKDGSIKVWDAATGKLLNTVWYNKKHKVQSLYLDKDGHTIISGITGFSRGLRMFDMNTGVETENYEIANVEHFDVSPNGFSIAVGSLHRKLYLVSLKKRTVTAVLKGHKGWTTDVCYNNTGRVMFTASNDNRVFAWLADGSKHMPVYKIKRDIDGVKCSPDGKYLAILGVNEKLTVMYVGNIEDEIRAYVPPAK